jgi:predicted metal-dependent phosphoesterase TrpH
LTAPPTFDLQSHSLHSDGALPPNEVVTAAAAAGVELLSLTDHDTVDGVAEARDAARAQGIELVTGVEISALDVDGRDLHILGYRIDDQQRQLREALEYFRGDRRRRAARMAEALRELGFELDDDVLSRRAGAGQSIGRPHLAEAVVNHPANTDRLLEEDVGEPSAFLEAYLIEGRPAYRARESPTIPEAIDTIHAAGGVAVWAHPFWDLAEVDHVRDAIERFAAAGIDGVECFYVTHTREQTDAAVACCTHLTLLMTGSSDFHGPAHREFSRFRAFSMYGHEPVLGVIARRPGSGSG